VKALLFAAGLGTRLKEYTSDKPKALVVVAGKPLLQHAIEYLKKNDISDITINVFHYADQIISFLDENKSFGANLHISDERDQLLETGGGLKKAGKYLSGKEPVLLYNVDIISNLDLKLLYDFHLKQNALATLVVRKRETSRYLMIDQNMNLAGWKNQQSGEIRVCRSDSIENAQPLAFSGIHIIQPELLDLITEEGKFPIMDLYLRLAQNHTIKAFVDTSTIWLDLGKPDQLQLAEKILNQRN
jgi:NDP-sugar pyrophosphorylase family protein